MMNIDEIPTPETDAAFKQWLLESDKSHRIRMRSKMRDLERRLNVARNGFKELINAIETGSFSNGEYSRCEIKQAKETLTQTAPKP